MKTLLHASAGMFSMLFLFVSFVVTIVAAFFYLPQDIIASQQAILQAIWVYFFFLLTAASIGLWLSKGRKERIVVVKKRRMLIILILSVFGLLPSVYLLASQSIGWEGGIIFFSIQAFELTVSAMLMMLLGLNVLDGLKLTANASAAS